MPVDFKRPGYFNVPGSNSTVLVSSGGSSVLYGTPLPAGATLETIIAVASGGILNLPFLDLFVDADTQCAVQVFSRISSAYAWAELDNPRYLAANSPESFFPGGLRFPGNELRVLLTNLGALQTRFQFILILRGL